MWKHWIKVFASFPGVKTKEKKAVLNVGYIYIYIHLFPSLDGKHGEKRLEESKKLEIGKGRGIL